MIVSLSIATVIFTAMAAGAIAGVRATVVARQNQMAVDVLNQVVEEARALLSFTVGDGPSDLRSTTPQSLAAGPHVLSRTASVLRTYGRRPRARSTLTSRLSRLRTAPTTPSSTTSPSPTASRWILPITEPEASHDRTVVGSRTGKNTNSVISTLLTETARGLPLPRYGVTPTSPTAARRRIPALF